MSVCLPVCLSVSLEMWAGTAGVALLSMYGLISGIWVLLLAFLFHDAYAEHALTSSLPMSQEEVTWPAVRHGFA